MRGYGIVWGQVKPFCDRLWIREMRTKHAQDVLDSSAVTGRFNINSLRHIKSFLSGAFKSALQQGYYEGPNPLRETSIAGVRPASETHAYSLEEIEAMLSVLTEPASTVIMAAALTGCRRGEIRGMAWENYRDGEMLIARSVWQSHITDPKSAGSKKPIPIIRLLAERLEAHRLSLGNPTSGPIFPNEIGKPTELKNLLNRSILPVLKAAGIQWHGWHGFRRGLGTNLYRLGVSDKMIQAILRHANVTTTQTFYVKTASEDAKAGMAKLENSLVARKWPEFSAVAGGSEVVN
jgi:integrase